ncbi:MAG: FAD:protein FMN transferase [Candidatus Latescibacterota bacterium]
MKKLLLACAGLLLVALLLRPESSSVPARGDRLAIGTLVTVKLYQDEESAQPLIAAAFAEFDRIDTLMSRQIDSSAVNRLESAAARGPVPAQEELAFVLERSQHFAQSTGGAFDVTVGALTRLWGFPEVTAPPDSDRVDSARAQAGYRHLSLRDGMVFLERPGIRLDLGGAAKGYAVDAAVRRLQELGAEAGLVDAGGNIRYWGRKPDGEPWRFGVRHPRDPERIIEVEDIGLEGIATSGDYEQYFIHGGRRYHHILDPATGYPAHGSVSATAWARTAMDADILSTAVFVLGPQRGLDWVESQEDMEAVVFYLEDGQLRHRASSGLARRLHFSGEED